MKESTLVLTFMICSVPKQIVQWEELFHSAKDLHLKYLQVNETNKKSDDVMNVTLQCISGI